MSHAAAPLELTEAQRATLGAIAKSTAAAHREVLRARVLLMAADGVANARIAGEVGVSVPTVREWRSRFAAEGLAKFAEVRKGRGRKVSIAQEKIDEIVRLTQYSKPPGQTHWSCRTMAKVDVVGLYMAPPDKAVVLCLDEKTRAPRGADVPVRDERPAAGHRSDRSKLRAGRARG
jgi:transposase